MVCRTLGISCKAVTASILAIAGMRRHLRPVVPFVAVPAIHFTGAAESLVSFIPLFDSIPRRRVVRATDVSLALVRRCYPDGASAPVTLRPAERNGT